MRVCGGTLWKMPEIEPVLPPCGHVDRLRELAELEVVARSGQTLLFLVCTVEDCPEYCRVFADLRDDHDAESLEMERLGRLAAEHGCFGSPSAEAEPG